MKENLVKSVARKLCVANNTVTTLEIKNELRKQYPNIVWNQYDVSKIMDDLHLKGYFTYQDNGVFRVYSFVGNDNKQPVIVSDSIDKLSKSRALEMIQNSKGMFFGVTFTKKDGSVRNMTCKINKDNTKPNNFGYLTVVDVVEGSPKSLNLQTLSELRINKKTYTIK